MRLVSAMPRQSCHTMRMLAARMLAAVLWAIGMPLLVASAVAAQHGVKAASSAGADASSPAIVMRTVEGAFEDVLQDVEDAIIGQGLKITYRADIAGMLARTGKDLGFQPIYKGGQVLQFCSARLSHEAMKADTRNIAFCPYGVFVFQTLDAADKAVIGYRPLPVGQATSDASRKAMQAINALLENIVREAAGE